MNLVAGATGYLGREICRLLTSQGRPTRGLVRSTSDPDALDQLRQLGVELVEGDLKDASSLEPACQGASAVLSTVTTTRSRQPDDSIEATDQQGQLNLVDAARGANVQRFVYISYSGQISSDNPLTRAKRTVEERVPASGMTYTILRPSYFMEVWLSPALGFDYPNARVTLYGSGENPISWISLADVAAFAVHSLENPAAENAIIELGGPEALSPLEVVRIFEELGGRPFEIQSVPKEVIRAQEVAATDSLQQAFAALMLNYAAGDPIPMTETLRRYPIPLRTVREYAQQVLTTTAPAAP
jgi:uncharacterized protein YbjT (DUF2867 family)